MQADDVARQAAHLCNLIPHVRIVAALLEQLVEGDFGFLGLVLLEQQVDARLLQRVAVRIQAAHPLDALLGVAQSVGRAVQFDHGQVVGEIVGLLGQQGVQLAARLGEAAALDVGDGQAVVSRFQPGVAVEHGAEALGGDAGGFLEHQLGARTHQLVAEAVGDALGGVLLGAVAGVGDARLGDRVGEEEFRRLGVVAILAHQALEHAGHGARIVAGFLQVEQADAVGFLFVLSGEAALLLDGGGLRTHDGGDTGVSGAGSGSNDAGEHGGHHRYLHALLGLDAAGEVALRQVRQLVSHHRGVFAFGLGVQQQAAVDPDDAAGGGEGVDLRAVEQDEFQAAVFQLAGLGQAIDAGFHIVLELRVGQLVDLPAQDAEPGAAKAVFLFRRDDR